MSYSFTITAGTKDEAGIKVDEELGKVEEFQPVHAVDRQAAQDAAEAFIEVLTNPEEGEHIVVSLHGSVSYRGEGNFTSASVGVNASVQRNPDFV